MVNKSLIYFIEDIISNMRLITLNGSMAAMPPGHWNSSWRCWMNSDRRGFQ